MIHLSILPEGFLHFQQKNLALTVLQRIAINFCRLLRLRENAILMMQQ